MDLTAPDKQGGKGQKIPELQSQLTCKTHKYTSIADTEQQQKDTQR